MNEKKANVERVLFGLANVVLLVVGIWFRFWKLGSVPGINGDEGWWGMQAVAFARTGKLLFSHTTAGNPVCMLFLWPLAIIHKFFNPSFTALRSVPALINGLSLILVFLLIRRFYGALFGLLGATLLAIAPTAIAHSRFAQDPSLSIFASTLVIGTSLLAIESNKMIALLLLVVFNFMFFAGSLWIHPTNVFLAPFLTFPITRLVRKRFSRTGLGLFGVTLVAALAVFFPQLRDYTEHHPFLNKPWMTLAGQRMFSADKWQDLFLQMSGLFNGITISDYMSGAAVPRTLYHYATLFVAICLAVGTGLELRSGKNRQFCLQILIASAAGLLLFFLFGGPESLHPHVERYGLWLLVPGILFMTLGFRGWWNVFPYYRYATIFWLIATGGGLLLSFHTNYFHEFKTSGGHSHQTFLTGTEEPKKAAFDGVLVNCESQPCHIIAQQWWHYWPIRYLASPHENIRVSMTLNEAREKEKLFLIEFTGSAEYQKSLDWIQTHKLAFNEMSVRAPNGSPILSTLKVQ